MQATLDELLAAQEGAVAPYRRANSLSSRD
jgi:hypothetical protein